MIAAERRDITTSSPAPSPRPDRRPCRRPATERGAPNDRSGLGQILVDLPLTPARCVVRLPAGWHTFVAFSAILLAAPRPVLPDLKCTRLGHTAPAERRADCPSRDSLVNRRAGIRSDCCRMDASEWLIGALALQT
jgi:hypothetical protein